MQYIFLNERSFNTCNLARGISSLPAHKFWASQSQLRRLLRLLLQVHLFIIKKNSLANFETNVSLHFRHLEYRYMSNINVFEVSSMR